MGSLPNLVGSDLQDAQDTAQAHGFYMLTSHDVTGMDRMSILDHDWKVCTQTPAQGSYDKNTTVDFGVVKKGEDC
jgi:hypothetical protein